MHLSEAILWLRHHPTTIHGDLEEFLQRCEEAVRARSAEETWRLAGRLAEARAESWSHHGGYHASEDWVAKELCPEFAAELRRLAPTLGSGEEIALGEVAADADPEAREAVTEYARAVAEDERSRTVEEIARFTRTRAFAWVREGLLAHAEDWDEMPSYPDAAIKIFHLLAEEYERRARARAN